MYKEVLNYISTDDPWSELYSYLNKYMNGSIENLFDLNVLYSTLLAQTTEGLSIPKWSTVVFPEKLRVSYMLSLALFSYNSTMQRLRVGKL